MPKKEGHIFIQGIISPWQDKSAEEWGEVNIKQVTKQIQDNADAEKLIVHIHSPGGDVDEGFGIHDILVSSGKEIETRIEGLCASIATVIAMAGTTRIITENSQFMIHNPWGDAWGDSDEMQKYADQLKAVENKIIDFYVAKTGADRDSVDQMMKNETWLSAIQAKELGFITDIITTIKAVAKYNPKNNLIMTKELETAIDSKFESFLDKIKSLFKGSIKNLTVTTGDGTVLDFGDQIETPEEIEVGMTAVIEGGGAPEGEYVMPDGVVLVFVAGAVTEIKPAEAEGETVEALKAKIKELTAQLAEAQTANSELQNSVEQFKKEFKEFRAQVTSDIKTFDPDNGGNDPPKNLLIPGRPIIGK